MTVGISINNIIRNHLPKLELVYTSVTGKEPQHLPVNPYDLETHFPAVESIGEQVEFDESQVPYLHDDNYIPEFDPENSPFDVTQLLYVDGSFEIFGSCDETFAGIIKTLSNLQTKHKIVLTNLESPRSKCATLFFLSKNFFDMPELFFPSSREEMWERFDAIVTDDPKILSVKPEGKISLKVENNFNKSVDSDYTIGSIKEFVADMENIIDHLKPKKYYE